MKRQTAFKSALELPRVKVGVPYNDFNHTMILNIISANIFFVMNKLGHEQASFCQAGSWRLAVLRVV